MATMFKRWRKLKGLTQKQVAEAVGLEYQSVQKWEKGEAAPRVGHWEELSKLFDVPVEEIMDEVSGDEVVSTSTGNITNTATANVNINGQGNVSSPLGNELHELIEQYMTLGEVKELVAKLRARKDNF